MYDSTQQITLDTSSAATCKTFPIGQSDYLLHRLVSCFGRKMNIQHLISFSQLYDPATEVCEKSISVLDLACNDKQNLEAVVRLRPSLDHLPEAGNPLLLRYGRLAAGGVDDLTLMLGVKVSFDIEGFPLFTTMGLYRA